MQFGVVNKSTILNRFVLHTLQRKITHLAVIARKTNIKLGILKRGETGKEPQNVLIGVCRYECWILLLFSSSPLSNYRVLCLFYVLLRLNA